MNDGATPPQRSQRAYKIALVIAVIVVVALAYRFGLFAQFAEPARAARTLAELGIWGYVAFIVAYAILQPFGVPGTVFVMAAPLIWPWPVAFVLSMIGTMAASVVGFSFSRFVARDWVSKMVPERFRRYEASLEKRGFWTVAFLRFVFWMPPPLHFFFGVSRVGFWAHFWGSVVGYALPLLAVSFFGEKLFELLKNAPREVWITLGVAVLTIAAAIFIARSSERRARSRQ